VGSVLRLVLHGDTGPGELNACIAPPAVAEGLRRVEYVEPADGGKVFASRFDAAQVHAKDLSNPGSFAPAATDTAVLTVVEAAAEVPEHGGDHGRAAAPGNEANGLARDRHTPGVIGQNGVHGVKAREIVVASQVCDGGGKGELGA